jgi:hypothetical protein
MVIPLAVLKRYNVPHEPSIIIVVHMVIPLAVSYVSKNFTNNKSDSLAVNGQLIAFYVLAALKRVADKSNFTCQPSFILLHYV